MLEEAEKKAKGVDTPNANKAIENEASKGITKDKPKSAKAKKTD